MHMMNTLEAIFT